jgi:hypothetical protein
MIPGRILEFPQIIKQILSSFGSQYLLTLLVVRVHVRDPDKLGESLLNGVYLLAEAEKHAKRL